jgi:hypothetical protein
MSRRLVLALSVLAIALISAVIWLWSCVPFYRGRPAFYWRAKVYERTHPTPGESEAPREPLPLEPTLGMPLDPAGIPVLVALLDDNDDQVRYFACNALTAHGPKAAPAVPALQRMLRHQDVFQRRNSVKALSTIGPDARDAIPDLIQALKDEDYWVNYFAAVALGRIGPEAREAVPALRELRASDRAKISYRGPGEEDTLFNRGIDKIGDAATWALKEIAPEEEGAVDR